MREAIVYPKDMKLDYLNSSSWYISSQSVNSSPTIFSIMNAPAGVSSSDFASWVGLEPGDVVTITTLLAL